MEASQHSIQLVTLTPCQPHRLAALPQSAPAAAAGGPGAGSAASGHSRRRCAIAACSPALSGARRRPSVSAAPASAKSSISMHASPCLHAGANCNNAPCASAVQEQCLQPRQVPENTNSVTGPHGTQRGPSDKHVDLDKQVVSVVLLLDTCPIDAYAPCEPRHMQQGLLCCWELKVTGYAPCAQDHWQQHALHVTRNPWHLAHTGLQWRRQA